MAITKQGQELFNERAREYAKQVTAETPTGETVQVADWYTEELPHVDLSDEAIEENLADIQEWITDEYSTIALIDEVMADFELLRTTTKTRIDVITKLARAVERLQAEVEK